MNLNSLIKSINISSLVKGTSNTLNVIKKIIPVYKEVKPFLSKEKKIFETTKKESIESNKSEFNDSLTFFH